MTTELTGGASSKILVVDDEESMRETLAAILEAEGYQVATASTGEEAVERCSQERFDVVLMDVRMPGIDGVETFRRIRCHQTGLRVILMSAFCTDEMKEAALDDGAVAFLPKPLDLDKVIGLIHDATDIAILVVESEERTSSLLNQQLRQQGYRVTVVDSPDRALELVQQIRFELIFIDVALPAMNGLELYLAIRKKSRNSVVIMIAGMDKELEALARAAVERNAYTFVRKPLDIDLVLTMLQRLIGRRMSGDQRKPDTV
ncbi:response regulator [Rhodopirellula sp. SWK7]|uniref:response regulator n=1 Tax=Rhodopirellula sp. SWK7 TaxID=595460 RepID=UPI0002BE7A8A|nr:response regulator [Rhodopirellula sp. SWK7]EMI43458.1 two component, sigma54 specific, transcriptional regulator, Fis family [Rhodopirellula sp. SWK7]